MTAKGTLRDYQIADLAFYIANPKCLNLSEPGTGKTPSVCAMQHFLWFEKGIGTAFVQPKGLMAKNRREILKFTNFKPEDVVIVDGTPAQVKAQLESGAKVFLMGFRRWALSWKQLPPYVKAVHVDEFHKGFKSAASQGTQSLFAAFDSGRMEWFISMTGTIISGKLESAYPAIRVVEPRYYGSYYDFLNQHAIRDADDKIIGWMNHQKLAAIFGRHAICRYFKDIFGEQEIVYQTEVAEMIPAQRELYDKFQEEAILELEKFFIDGTQPGVGFIRARQIMEHPNHFPDLTEPGKFVDLIGGTLSGKEELLQTHLDDHVEREEPLIIFSPLVPQQQRIAKLLDEAGLRYGMINGSTPMKDRDVIDQAFQKGELQVVLCSPACADVGFNWQFNGKKEVGHIIFTAMDYLDTTFIQAMRRAIRENRSTPLRVTILEYADSLDQRILEIVHAKSLDAYRVDPNRPVLQLSRFSND